jgi:uncharacterized protein with NRDE domain
MCLIAFAIGMLPLRPLVLAANRDEYFDRPTEPLHRWSLPDGTEVVGGRDLREGGTWLAVNEIGRVAMLTNVRSAQSPGGRRSRGEITTRWLEASMDWTGLLEGLDGGEYGGFNLVVGDLRTDFWAWISNRDPGNPHEEQSGSLYHRRLEPGIYGLSNASLDTAWPKTLRLKHALGSVLRNGQPSLDPLVNALSDREAPPISELPVTGVPADLELALASPFVDMSARGYGTRSSLLLDVTAHGKGICADLTEWTHALPACGPHRWTDAEPRRLRVD